VLQYVCRGACRQLPGALFFEGRGWAAGGADAGKARPHAWVAVTLMHEASCIPPCRFARRIAPRAGRCWMLRRLSSATTRGELSNVRVVACMIACPSLVEECHREG